MTTRLRRCYVNISLVGFVELPSCTARQAIETELVLAGVLACEIEVTFLLDFLFTDYAQEGLINDIRHRCFLDCMAHLAPYLCLFCILDAACLAVVFASVGEG